jgi:alpha-beta hydrolase superfamily lysophospholipase
MQILADSMPPIFVDAMSDTITFDYGIDNVLFNSNSGNKLHGWFITPNDSISPEVTLLFLHGNGGNIVSYLSFIFPFVKQGYQAFIFDYSGFGLSQGEPSRKNVLLDANAALQYLAKRDDVMDTKLVIYGQSLGGHLTPTVANNNQDLIDGVVIEGAFSSHKDIAAEGAGFFGRLFVKETYPATQALKGLLKPILIIHSTEDKVVPFHMGEKLFKHANNPKEFFPIDGCHICGPTLYAEKISEKIKIMLNIITPEK